LRWLPSVSASRSLSYLEQLFGKLRRHELVESTRGPGGGYSLGRKAEEISVADIIVAVDEPIDATGCGGKENCMGDDIGRCMTHELWANLNAKMIEYLDSINLRKLVDDQLAKGVTIEEAPVKRAISSVPVVKPIKVTAPNSVFALGNAFSK
jgi:Rrf2 family iron-sulfur cluster assembly transcriptional regulator